MSYRDILFLSDKAFTVKGTWLALGYALWETPASQTLRLSGTRLRHAPSFTLDDKYISMIKLTTMPPELSRCTP